MVCVRSVFGICLRCLPSGARRQPQRLPTLLSFLGGLALCCHPVRTPFTIALRFGVALPVLSIACCLLHAVSCDVNVFLDRHSLPSDVSPYPIGSLSLNTFYARGHSGDAALFSMDRLYSLATCLPFLLPHKFHLTFFFALFLVWCC